jgi:hypothetical protein
MMSEPEKADELELLPIMPPLPIIPEFLSESEEPRLIVQPARAIVEMSTAPLTAMVRMVVLFNLFPYVIKKM